MEKVTMTAIHPGVQATALEAQLRNLPRDVHKLHGRSPIIAEPRNQKEQAISPSRDLEKQWSRPSIKQ